MLLQNMNTSVDPCDDFYQVCLWNDFMQWSTVHFRNHLDFLWSNTTIATGNEANIISRRHEQALVSEFKYFYKSNIQCMSSFKNIIFQFACGGFEERVVIPDDRYNDKKC